MIKNTILFQKRICETLSGNLAYTVGRLAFCQGRPMLVEHLGHLYLEHDLRGKVLTEGYGPEYDIVHVWAEKTMEPPLSSRPLRPFKPHRHAFMPADAGNKPEPMTT